MSGSNNLCTSSSTNTLLIEEGGHYLLGPCDELPYRLRRSLGHGHSGNVEEVEDTRTGAVYARKTIRIYGSRDKAERRRIFDNEIQIIRSLASHRHIIQIFATYIAKREVGLILQPVADDGDLDAFLDRFREDAQESESAGDGKPDQIKTAILQRAFGCLANGLEFMHQRRVRHKDIKPKNILIHRGLVLYTDFGYSLDSSLSNHSTTVGRPQFLTRRYSAPEVLQHESRNSRSDIFSLGCVFIEILSVLEKNLDIDERVCFGEDINKVHRCLEKANAQTPTRFLANLSDICISMTQPEPLSRSNASQVLASIEQNLSYFCAQCQPKQNPEAHKIIWKRQTGSPPKMMRIIGDQTTLGSVSTDVGSTISNPIAVAKVEGALSTIIQLDERDQYFLSHFIDNVLRLIFPFLEVNPHALARSDIIVPALESNKSYLHCCLSISALHLRATKKIQGEQINSDITRHRYASISELNKAINRDTAHEEILETVLGMTFFQCSVGQPDEYFLDIPWHQHFHGATSIMHKLTLPEHLVALNSQPYSRRPFSLSFASWIDILGATMLRCTPYFADTYREKLIADAPSGLVQLMGCEDRIMYWISEIACLEALKLDKLDEIQLCAHIKLLGGQLDLSEPPPGTMENAYDSLTGVIRPRQLSHNITSVFCLAARIYLCSLVPDVDRTDASLANLVEAVTDAMNFIPAGPNGFDRSLVWPLLVTGSLSLPHSPFRKMFADRSTLLGEASELGSFGRIKELLKDVWRINDDALAKGDKRGVPWQDTMRQKGWDFLLI
jgi:serine/threonine protein kinase